MTEWLKHDADGYRWTDARTFARHQDVELLTLPRSVRIILAAALRGAACGAWTSKNASASRSGALASAISCASGRSSISRLLARSSVQTPDRGDSGRYLNRLTEPMTMQSAEPSFSVTVFTSSSG